MTWRKHCTAQGKVLAYMFSAFVAIITILEMGTRVVSHITGRCHPLCITEFDSMLGWTLMSESSGQHVNAEFSIDQIYRINASGLRVSEHTTVDERAMRVLVLGDSVGFGWGVDVRSTFSSHIQSALATDVLNRSVTGFSTDQQLLSLRLEAPRFRPDFVVIQFTPNDLDDIRRSWSAGRPKPWLSKRNHSLELHNVPVRLLQQDSQQAIGGWLPLTLRDWLLRHSYLYHWLNSRRMEAVTADAIAASKHGEAIALFRAILLEMGSIASASGAAVVLLHNSPELQALGEDAIPTGVDVIFLGDKFQSNGHAMFPDNLHWTAEGHRIAAESVISWIRDHSRD